MTEASGNGWDSHAIAEDAAARAASIPGGKFTWLCPCGSSFTVIGGPGGPAEVKRTADAHMHREHPGVLEELTDLRAKGVRGEFADIFIRQWAFSVHEGR